MKTTLTLIIILLAGCTQRIASYNPETGEIYYKSNSIATDTSADNVKITAGGVMVEINKIYQDNDSGKAVALRYNRNR